MFKVQLFVMVKIRIRIRMDPVRNEGESWIRIRIETNADPQDCLFLKETAFSFATFT
jgi:hypothetical protein